MTPTVTKAKKPRKHNQLGLTPASQVHESSSGDENEEANLKAANVIYTPTLVQFAYKGQTAILKTAAEIAAWIVERKRRYPTVAKAEAAKKEASEKKRKWAEEKKRREEAAKVKRSEREKSRPEAEELRRKLLDSQKKKQEEKLQKEAEQDEEEGGEQNKDHLPNKARLEAEKLRQKAEKAEIKAIKAEATAKIARVRRGRLQRQESSEMKENSMKDGDSAIVMDDLVEEHVPNTTTKIELQETPGLKRDEDSKAIDPGVTIKRMASNSKEEELEDSQLSDASSSSSLSISDSSEMSDSGVTSSSGSSSSDSDSDSPPEQATTKRLAPDRGPPPPRQSNYCRRMIKFGKCRYGPECPFSHDLPDKLSGPRHADKRKTEEISGKKERRKGLWQVMVDKELEIERKQVLKAIVFMGERGMLDEDKGADSEVKASSGSVNVTSSEDVMIQAAAAKGIIA